MSLYRKYINLRKPNTPHRRFFVFYKKGHCTVQCVGVNTFGKIPSEIAAYLKLPNPHLYTGHSFRRSSASILADSGEEITSIKRLGGWKSTFLAEGYLEESTKHKKDISNKILGMNIVKFVGVRQRDIFKYTLLFQSIHRNCTLKQSVSICY